MIEVISIPTLSDNYVWLIKNSLDNNCCVVDPGAADPVLEVLALHNLKLNGILITHHHYDHIDGIPELLANSELTARNSAPVTIYSSIAMPEFENVITVADGDKIQPFSNDFQLSVMATPGHKREHVVYHNDQLLFSGDTLFSGGCGRILDGSACELFHSLGKITQLNDELLVYPTHEYTQANLMFCHAVEPHNEALKIAISETAKLRQRGLPTLPSTLKKEKQINVFLRTNEPMIRSVLEDRLTLLLDSEQSIFTELRSWKDNF